MSEKKGFHQTVTFWLLFAMTIFFVISFLSNVISLFDLAIDTRAKFNILNGTINTSSTMYLEEGTLIFASIFAGLSLILSLIAYIASFSPMHKGIISKTVNRVILLIFISSFIYAIFQIIVLASLH